MIITVVLAVSLGLLIGLLIGVFTGYLWCLKRHSQTAIEEVEQVAPPVESSTWMSWYGQQTN